MMSIGKVSTIATLGLTLLALGGCASSEIAAVQGNASVAIHDLGGTLDAAYQQRVLSKDMISGAYSSELIYLVPEGTGKGFKIVDSRGVIYSDFDDFLRRNSPKMSADDE
jgi:hypothetical protein